MRTKRSFLRAAGAGLLTLSARGSFAAPSFAGEVLELGDPQVTSLRHVKAFGTGRSQVGSGGDDTYALQAAIDSQEIIDLSGTQLRISDGIKIGYPSAAICSAMSNRTGRAANSGIFVVEDEMPALFECTASNFEAYGFRVEASKRNKTTTFFHFQRPSLTGSDIDAVLASLSSSYGRKLFHHYGRGLKLSDVSVEMPAECVGDLDWPMNWSPNGLSSDTQETGMRAYELRGIRMHGAPAGIRNVGTNAQNCRGIVMSDVLADIGAGGVFVGVAVESQFANIISQLNATTGGCLFDLYPGSRKSNFVGFTGGGIQTDNVTRLSRNMIKIHASSSLGVAELHFIGGSIGPTARDGVQIYGGGKAENILFHGVSFDRCGLEPRIARCPISIFEKDDVFSDVTVKLAACNFNTIGTTAPYVVGGMNSSRVQILRDGLTTKSETTLWAQSNVRVT